MPPYKHQFKIDSPFEPSGDQPEAIASLLKGISQKQKDQVLLGVTGSGKTFTMAHVIANTGRPAMIIAHNKTLAAQLYHEMKSFFPQNAVEYFVSYYDYYQPEAYVPSSDTYIEKDSSINEQIDRMRHSATRSLLERRDVIVVASVSCIYGIGSAESYGQMTVTLNAGTTVPMRDLIKNLVEIHYKRNDLAFQRGTFRVKGDTLDLFPAHLEDQAWRLSFFGDELESIHAFDPLTGESQGHLDQVSIYANSHYVTPRPTMEKAIRLIKEELKERSAQLESQGKLLELQRLQQRTQFDLEMMTETGTCKGIENYSRYLTGQKAGEPPPTLFQYLPKDALLFIDESHVTLPQIRAMYNGDRARKETLVEYGFRLPSALDNRPLKFEEWERMRPQTIHVSATPGKIELGWTEGKFIEQVIRPTGLIDPICHIRPVTKQVDDLLHECREQAKLGRRVLVTTLTKKMAEQLTEYMEETGLKVRYLHSDVDTLERIDIIRDLRLGTYDILVGVNLLREGLDIPECGLVAILDADKEGFLRSETSLVQTIGRAARNVDGKVILYADKITDSMKAALDETDRRRNKQIEYNKKHGITPKSVIRAIAAAMNEEKAGDPYSKDYSTVSLRAADSAQAEFAHAKDKESLLRMMRDKMLRAAADLEFEEAARLRDEIERLQSGEMVKKKARR